MEKSINRKPYLDVLKGIGIFFVVFGHVTHIGVLREYIWNFHMPLFFWISGLLFNEGKFNTFADILKSRLKSIYIPYVFFYLITFTYWVLIERNVRGGEYSIIHQFIGLFYGTYEGDHMYFNGALWFLPCLFAVELLFYSMLKIKDKVNIIASIILSFVVGVIILKIKFNILPFGLHTAFFGMVFYGLGFLSKTIVEKLKQTSILNMAILLIASFFIQFISLGVYSSTIVDTTLPYISLASFGILFYLVISIIISKNKYIEYIGINSLVILAFQEPIYRAVIYIFSKVLSLDTEVIRTNIYYCLLVSLVAFGLIIPIILFYNKFIKVRINMLFN